MTKQDIIDFLTYNKGLHRSSAIAAIEGTLEAIATSLASGKDVTLRGFGTFHVATTAQKVGRNIAAGTPVTIPSRRTVKLVLAKDLKAKLNP
jgi:DNA-binding protein HU-beta